MPRHVLGVSAGGHAARTLSSRFNAQAHSELDDFDLVSARPDPATLIYPDAAMARPFAHEGSRLNLLGAEPSSEAVRAWSLEHMVRPDMPPVFLLHSGDDAAVPVENSLVLYSALRASGVPAVLHVFEAGGHGFGLRGIKGTPLEVWPRLLLQWSASKGIHVKRSVSRQ